MDPGYGPELPLNIAKALNTEDRDSFMTGVNNAVDVIKGGIPQMALFRAKTHWVTKAQTSGFSLVT